MEKAGDLAFLPFGLGLWLRGWEKREREDQLPKKRKEEEEEDSANKQT